MSNPFYAFAPSFVPGSLARAGDVNTQMTNIQTGFDKVNTGNVAVGADSGSANAVILTMTTTRTAYTNGDEFVFTPAVQNTGASTIKVDALGAIPLVRYNGTALQAADLLVGTWYTGRYASASNSVQIISPAAFTLAAGIVSAAAPTHKVGLVAAGGVSVNVLPIDATFAIDQSIAPTWTSLHTFSAGATFNAGVTVNAATRNVATLGQSAQTYGNAIDNPTYTFQGSGAFSVGGNISAANFGGFANPTASLGLAAVNGAAITAMRSDAAPALSQAIVPTWTGQHTFSATSGSAITISQPQALMSMNSATSTSAPQIFMNLGGVNKGRFGVEGTAGGVITGSSANDVFALTLGGNFIVSTNSGGGVAFRVGSNGNVTINAPTSGSTLTVNGASASPVIANFAASAGGIGFIGVQDGQTGTRQYLLAAGFPSVGSFSIYDNTAGSARLTVSSTGNVTIPAPSSGTALSVTGVAGASSATVVTAPNSASNSFGLRVWGGTNSSDFNAAFSNAAQTVTYLLVRGDGIVQALDQGNNLQDVGWRGTPLNVQSSNYVLTVADRGKSVQASASITITVNTGVFAGGDAVTIFVGSGATVTIAQGAGMTFQWAGNGATTGSRTLTGAGIVTLVFASSAVALITGAGLT